MTPVTIEIKDDVKPDQAAVLELYRANKWSSANKPDQLYKGLMHSHSLVTAWYGERLVGLGNALSDGHLVVYYPHLSVHPDFQGMGIGKSIVQRFQEKYHGLHQQALIAEGRAIEFYEKCGFEKAGQTQSMWIYDGDEH